MKKVLALCLAAVMSLGLLAGCGGGGKGDSGEKKKVGFVVGSSLGDQSFLDSCWSGLEKAKNELNYTTKAIELGGDKSKYESGIVDGAENNDIVVTTGMEMLDYVLKHAKDFPDKKFIVADVDTDSKIEEPNVIGIHYQQNEGDFLAGAVAAMKSKTGVVGFIGGMDSLVINDFLIGYIQGAQAVNKDIKVAVSYVGSYSDGAKGGEFANSQMTNKKADVIHPVAGGSGIGALEKVAEKEGVYAIGVDSDQYAMLKDTKPKVAERIITSSLKNVGDSVFEQLKAIQDDKWKADGKHVIVLGIKENAVALVENDNYKKLMTEDELKKLDELKEKVSKGEIKIDTAYGKSTKEINDIINKVKP